MSTNIPTFYDPKYHNRYGERNARKLEAILANITPVASVLDIGCNAGYVSEAMLKSGKAKQATGIELKREAVSAELLARSDFDLFEGSVVDFQFDRTYDAIFYLSIHHHIFGGYGRERAFQLWRDIVSHCNQYLFYEPALVTEQGKPSVLYWKEVIKEQFSDEDHWRLLKAAIGPRLKKIDRIAELPIHEALRPLYRIELYPLRSEHDLQPETVYGSKLGSDDDWEVVQKLYRTHGRASQQLLEKGKDVYTGTQFFILRNKKSGEQHFGKKTVEDPYRQMREFMINSQIDHSHVLPVLSVTPSYGLIFPYIDWPILENLHSKIENPDEFWDKLSTMRDEILDLKINTGFFDLDPAAYHSTRRVGDMVDMNVSNILVRVEGGRAVDWRFIDFEYFFETARKAGRNTSKHRVMIQRKIMKLGGFRAWLRQLWKGNT